MADSDPEGIQQCQLKKKLEECAALRKKIDELISRNKHDPAAPNFGKGRHGLEHRFREIISNLRKYYAEGWDPEKLQKAKTHLNEIVEAKDDLASALRQLRDKGCGDPPPGGWSWATRDVKEFENAIDKASDGLGDAAKVAGGALAGAGAAYLAYRVVRMIPSLFPPLWGTIPLNSALP